MTPTLRPTPSPTAAQIRTPLARARGLGSAKEGATHFWRQRVTGVANVFLVILLTWVFVKLAGADYAAAKATLKNPLVSLLVSNPTRTDPSLAPGGRQIYYLLAPTPNTDARLDWTRLAPAYREHVLATLEARGYPGLSESIEVEHVTTPADWQVRGMERGTPFAAAHTFAQTGPFRPGTLWGENIVFTGSGTQPGVGVPMVLISGRLAAERILGPDPGYRSRAWR